MRSSSSFLLFSIFSCKDFILINPYSLTERCLLPQKYNTFYRSITNELSWTPKHQESILIFTIEYSQNIFIDISLKKGNVNKTNNYEINKIQKKRTMMVKGHTRSYMMPQSQKSYDKSVLVLPRYQALETLLAFLKESALHLS